MKSTRRSNRRGVAIGLGAACLLAAAAGLAVTWNSGEEMAAPTDRRFCERAEVLSLGKGEELAVAEKLAVIRDLRDMAPDAVRADFDVLIHWYEPPHTDAHHVSKASAKETSVRVGQYIERSCSLNLGGIRS